MTEKRFIIDDVGTLIDMQTRNTYDYVSDVCPLLNALNDENEELKSELGKLNILYKAKCKTEEQLIKMGKEVEKENEQLKQELGIYCKVASCGNCKYHNYDWYDDGDEFEVCDKGNDVTDRICEDWEEL